MTEFKALFKLSLNSWEDSAFLSFWVLNDDGVVVLHK